MAECGRDGIVERQGELIDEANNKFLDYIQSRLRETVAFVFQSVARQKTKATEENWEME